ncbi:MAG: hypothetical protein ABJN26_25340 [Stappiaceae bacterium]
MEVDVEARLIEEMETWPTRLLKSQVAAFCKLTFSQIFKEQIETAKVEWSETPSRELQKSLEERQKGKPQTESAEKIRQDWMESLRNVLIGLWQDVEGPIEYDVDYIASGIGVVTECMEYSGFTRAQIEETLSILRPKTGGKF